MFTLGQIRLVRTASLTAVGSSANRLPFELQERIFLQILIYLI